MTRRIGIRSLAAVGMVVALGLAPSSVAFAARKGGLGAATCGRGQTLVRVDTKVCPALPRRPALTIKRACCENRSGKVHCRPFAHCPSRSPS